MSFYINYTISEVVLDPSICTVFNFFFQFLYQWTPLHIAVREFQVRTVEFLVANGADVTIMNNDGVSM